jgi:uncharacterized protein (TIGR00369 family)
MTAYPRSETYPTPERPPAEWRSWADGLPMSLWCGLHCLDIGFGHYSCVMPESPLALNPNGSVNGGATAAVADHCMGVVAMTVLAPAAVGVTAALTAEYHRPAYPPLTFKARATSHGSTLLFVQVDVEDRELRLCVRAQGTMVSRRLQPGALTPPDRCEPARRPSSQPGAD